MMSSPRRWCAFSRCCSTNLKYPVQCVLRAPRGARVMAKPWQRRLQIVAAALARPISAPTRAAAEEEAVLERAQAIHAKAISIDTHIDINPRNFTHEKSYADRLDSQVDLVKMQEGGLDAVFLVAYVGQVPDFTPEGFARAHENVMTKFDAIHRLCNELAPERCELATTAADVRRIKAAGKSAILIGVENGYSMGEDIRNVEKFYNLGARYMSLAHNGHSHLVDSHTGERDGEFPHNGLSPLGRQVIQEMNRLGMMVDISHPSKEGNRQTMELSRAPVIASHSSARALASSSRNLEDDELRAVAATGGVVQTVAFNSFVKDPLPDSPGRVAAIAQLRGAFDLAPEGARTLQQLSAEQRAEYTTAYKELATVHPPPPRATVSDFVDHIDHVVGVIGIDHCGISSDMDGGGGVEGWNSASETLNVTIELVRRGYTESQICQLWGGNLLRVMERCADVAEKIQAEMMSEVTK